MTIISSGQLALQDAGTNPTGSTTPLNHNTSFTTGLDGLLQMQQINEIGDGNFVTTTVWQGDAYGYNLNMFSTSYIHQVFNLSNGPGIGNRKYQSTSNFGSLGDTTYSDDNNTTRTISGVFWGLPDASPNNVRLFIFGMGGTSVPNADTTWEKIEIITSGGTTVTINRTDLSYDASENGDTFWYWKGSSGTMYTNLTSLGTPSSGTSYTLKVYGDTVATTVNNGIAEEMGGADSSNVKMSDYYSNGTFMGNVTGIPTSGQLKMSDFLGKTFVGQVFDHTTTLLPDYWAYSSGSYITYYYAGFMSGDSTYNGSGDSLGDATFPNTGTITFGGLTRNANDVEITQATFSSVNNATTSTGFTMILKDYSSDRGTSWTGTGFTNLEIYLDQSNTTGTPDLTLALADATATYSSQSTYTQINLFWAAADGGQQNYSNYFGTSTTPATNGTQTLNITGLS
jgi:hypothetical protein